MLQAMVKLRGVMDPLYGLDGGVSLDMVWFLTSVSQTGCNFCASLSEGYCLVNNY